MSDSGLNYQDIAQVRGQMYAMVTGLDLRQEPHAGSAIVHRSVMELPDGQTVQIEYKVTITRRNQVHGRTANHRSGEES